MSSSPSNLKAVRGTRDLLPPETALWAHIEQTARDVFARYGFGEIRTPVFEATELFARGVGEETDIVSKEMYTWEDGERFSEQKLATTWLDVNRSAVHLQGTQVKVSGSNKTVDLIVFRKSDNALEFVEFKAKASIEALNALRESIVRARQFDPMNYGNLRIVARLVVPAGRGRLPTGYKLEAGSVIEEFAGDFFESSQSLTLRPENTAGVVRAYIEHKLGETGQLQKLFYIGPQFRRERPQRGRYRQFWQIGCEVLGPQSSGAESPIRDAEVLEMLATLLDELGVKNWRLELNSVGSSEDRRRYNAALREALIPLKHKMSEDNQRRAETNPLRVLDSKDPVDQEIIANLPRIADYLDEESRNHFAQVIIALQACGVPFVLNPRLVRGLDYYTRTTFEFTIPDGSGLGTQNAVLGGGRYDGLSEMLGGPKAPGIGFAIGEDRLVLTLQAQTEADRAAKNAGAPGASPLGTWESANKLDAYIAPMGAERNAAALALARELRRAGLSVEVGNGTFRLKKSFEAADRVARHIVILGEDELASNTATVKTFSTGEQVKLPHAKLIDLLGH